MNVGSFAVSGCGSTPASACLAVNVACRPVELAIDAPEKTGWVAVATSRTGPGDKDWPRRQGRVTG